MKALGHFPATTKSLMGGVKAPEKGGEKKKKWPPITKGEKPLKIRWRKRRPKSPLQIKGGKSKDGKEGKGIFTEP